MMNAVNWRVHPKLPKVASTFDKAQHCGAADLIMVEESLIYYSYHYLHTLLHKITILDTALCELAEMKL